MATFHIRDRDTDLILIEYQVGGRGDWFPLRWVTVGFFIGVRIPATCWTNHSEPLSPNHSNEIFFRVYDNRFYSDPELKVTYTLYHTGAPVISVISDPDPSKIEGDDLTLELSIIDANAIQFHYFIHILLRRVMILYLCFWKEFILLIQC
jgi:hypothetical protein